MVGRAFERNVFFLDEAVEDTFYINLADCVFGPEELDLLLKEWLKDPQPKTINEFARIYLTLQYEAETGFLPYDSRNTYKVKDKIKVRTVEGYVTMAEVISYARNTHKDSDGFTWDQMDVRLLSQEAKLNHDKIHTFVANYKGNGFRASTNFEVIREKDEVEVIPKILQAISGDNRFVAFKEKWLPSDLLVTDVSNMRNDVRVIIAQCKQALSTHDILEKVYTHDNKEELGNRLEFSLNYFLKKDRRFESSTESDSITKWDLRKPSGPVLVSIGQRTLSGSKLPTTSDLDLLLFYHGFIDQCVFSFQYERKITAYRDISEGAICGEEFVNELAKLSENREFKVKFENPEHRGDPICVSAPDEHEKIQSTITIRQEWLADGVLRVPKRISSYMKGTNTVHILYDQLDEVLPYDEGDRFINGLDKYYSEKAIAEFDKVHLQLESLKPTRLFIHSSWKVSLDKLLRIEPQDLDWEQSSVRDCIIVVLAKFRTPAHYREIYTEIAIHKHVSWGGILGTLSRYCPSVFVHVGWGKWQLAGWAEEVILPEQEPKVPAETVVINDEIWNAVTTIEENDYVYKLLEKIRKPLSFDEVCSRLADYLKVDVHELRATGFLKADDERFRRLDDGTWALEEWFSRDDDTELTKPCSEKTSKSGLFWLLLTIVLILLLIGTASALIWLFIYGR